MNNKKESDSIRIAIVSALAAIFVGLLAVLHDSKSLLGFFVVDGGFVGQIYNFVIVLLFIELLLCIIFLSSTGFIYNLKGEEYSVAKWIQKKVYSWLMVVFPFSVVSIMYNIVTKAFGLNTWASIGVLIAVIVIVIIMAVFIVWIKARGGNKKHD